MRTNSQAISGLCDPDETPKAQPAFIAGRLTVLLPATGMGDTPHLSTIWL